MKLTLEVELTEHQESIIMRLPNVPNVLVRDITSLVKMGLIEKVDFALWQLTELGEQAKAILSKKADSDQEVVR